LLDEWTVRATIHYDEFFHNNQKCINKSMRVIQMQYYVVTDTIED